MSRWIIISFIFFTLSQGRADQLLPESTASVSQGGRGGVTAVVEASSKYVYNVFYDYLRSVNDAAFDVAPSAKAVLGHGSLRFAADAQGLYEQFLTNTVQNHFDFATDLAAQINSEESPSFRIGGTFKSFSDPSPTETFGRLQRAETGGSAAMTLRTEKGNTLDLKARFETETWNIPKIYTSLFNNNLIDGEAQYNNVFLPETSWVIRVTGGMRQFPTKTPDPRDTSPLLTARPYGMVSPAFKNDSIYALAETGFVGRLSDKTSVDSAVGWLMRMYSQDTAASDSFSAPVFYARFTEQITRRDQFVVGYDYKVEDSYFTNYLLRQEIYAGFVKIYGDQVLVLSRIGYQYNSYSLPNRRDDERVIASFVAHYSITPTFKLTADLKIDLLSSDAYDTGQVTDQAFMPDRPASYKAGSLGFGILAAF